MRKVFIVAVFALSTIPCVASAQEGLATNSTLGGRNTIQEAPTVGAGRGITSRKGTSAYRGPSNLDRRLERSDEFYTRICRGC